MARAKKTPSVSVINWMGTLLLCAIPGVNILTVILTLIFAKNPSKKSFALALLLLMIFIVLLAVVLLLVLPEQAAQLADFLREAASNAPVPAETIAP